MSVLLRQVCSFKGPRAIWETTKSSLVRSGILKRITFNRARLLASLNYVPISCSSNLVFRLDGRGCVQQQLPTPCSSISVMGEEKWAIPEKMGCWLKMINPKQKHRAVEEYTTSMLRIILDSSIPYAFHDYPIWKCKAGVSGPVF